MAHCIPTYMLASGLIGGGHELAAGAAHHPARQHSIVLVPILLNSHPGTKYGIPFPVFARAAYGTRGSNVPGADARARGLRLVRHPGVDRRRGAARLLPLAVAGLAGGDSRHRFAGHAPTEWISFLLFWALNILIIYRGMDLLRQVENWAAPFVLVMTQRSWCGGRCPQAHGLGPLLAQTGKARVVGPSSGRSSCRR